MKNVFLIIITILIITIGIRTYTVTNIAKETHLSEEYLDRSLRHETSKPLNNKVKIYGLTWNQKQERSDDENNIIWSQTFSVKGKLYALHGKKEGSWQAYIEPFEVIVDGEIVSSFDGLFKNLVEINYETNEESVQVNIQAELDKSDTAILNQIYSLFSFEKSKYSRFSSDILGEYEEAINSENDGSLISVTSRSYQLSKMRPEIDIHIKNFTKSSFYSESLAELNFDLELELSSSDSRKKSTLLQSAYASILSDVDAFSIEQASVKFSKKDAINDDQKYWKEYVKLKVAQELEPFEKTIAQLSLISDNELNEAKHLSYIRELKKYVITDPSIVLSFPNLLVANDYPEWLQGALVSIAASLDNEQGQQVLTQILKDPSQPRYSIEHSIYSSNFISEPTSEMIDTMIHKVSYENSPDLKLNTLLALGSISGKVTDSRFDTIKQLLESTLSKSEGSTTIATLEAIANSGRKEFSTSLVEYTMKSKSVSSELVAAFQSIDSKTGFQVLVEKYSLIENVSSN